MCGIAGYIDPCGISRRALQRMSEVLAHRGPDDEGFLLLNARGEGCALRGPHSAAGMEVLDHIDSSCTGFPALMGWVHRRLSIIDLSTDGHQPMQAGDRVWMMMNGEIYNYPELRAELTSRGHRFRSSSDTEVALNAYLEWGTGCFHRFRGMWAMAFFDQRSGELLLSRDRFAIKPLYLIHQDQIFAFASEIKALLEIPGIHPVADNRQLYQYLSFPGLNDPYATLFSGIRELEAGTVLTTGLRDRAVRKLSYYDLEDRSLSLASGAEGGDPLEGYASLLEQSVALHLRSDVPVGSCLSGGLTSSM